MLTQNNEYLQEAVSRVAQLTEDEQIRQLCQAREDFEYWERIRNASYQRELDARNNKIAELQNQIAEQHHHMTEQQRHMTEQQSKITEQQNQIAEQQAELDHLRTLLANKKNK